MENLKKRIFFSGIISLAIGILLNTIGKEDRLFQTHVIATVAVLYKIFIFLVQIILIPMVISAIINSARMIVKAFKKDKLGNVTLLFFLGTTLLAIVISIFLSEKFTYFVDYNLSSFTRYTNNIFINSHSPNFYFLIVESIGKYITKVGLLIVISFSFIFGMIIEIYDKKWTESIKNIVETWQEKLSRFLQRLIQFIFLPVFGYCLVIFSTIGLKVLAIMIYYGVFLTVILIIFVVIIYGSLVKLYGKIGIFEFYKNIKTLYRLVFKNPNSNEALPVTVSTTINKFGVSEKTTEFVLDMGRTMNRHGTAIMQCMAVILMAKVYGVSIDSLGIISLAILVFLIAQGTFSIPFDGIITMTILFQFFGIPIESIFLILGVDKTFEAMRTSVNVIGDVVCAILVDRNLFMQGKK